MTEGIDYIDDKVVNQWSAKVEAQMRSVLTSAGKTVTGKLIQSIDIVDSSNGDGTKTTVGLNFTDYGKFVLYGRRPGGKMPPLETLTNWMSVKGIEPKYAFPIAKTIALKGIKPFDFTMPFYQGIPELTDGLARALAEDVAKYVADEIKNMNK